MAKKLWVENISLPAVAYQEESPTGDWIDSTNDASAWHFFGRYVMGYLFYRDKINEILIVKANPNYPTIDFSGFFSVLTAEERQLMCEYVLAPYALRLMVVSEEEDIANWETLLQITQGTEPIKYPYTGRALLIEKMRRHVAHKVRREELAMADTQLFFKDVFELTEWYIRAATPDFKLWLYSEAPYDVTGFNSKSYWSQGLEDELKLIYNEG